MTDKTTGSCNPAALSNFARSRPAHMRGRFYMQILPWLVLAVSMVVSYQLWQGARQNALQALHIQFDNHVRNITDDITDRMKAYEQVMRGVDGLFAHASIVERNEFHDYIARLDLKENFPGIQAIRYIPLVPLAQKDRHIAAVRKDGIPGYSIFPDGQRSFYAPVIYAEPYDERNKTVFGYDMLSDRDYPQPGDSGAGLRRAAMESARDSGHASVSGKIWLLFEKKQDKQAGFIMFLPVYRHDAPHGTLAERRANLVGWIGSVFRMDDLMKGIIGDRKGEVDIDIYDGEEISNSSMMYDSDGKGTVKEEDLDQNSRFHASQRINIAGHKWALLIRSLHGLDAMLDMEKPKTVAYTGMAASLLLALFTWLLVTGQERTAQAAKVVERVSHKNEMLLRTASDGIYILDLDGNVLQVNDAFCLMLGYTSKEMQGMNVAQWNAQWSNEKLMARINALEAGNTVFETRHRRRDGSIIDVEVNASRVEIDGQPVIYNSTRDITERKKTEQSLRESEERWSFALEGSGDGVWDWDLQTGRIVFSRRYKEILGFQGDTNWGSLGDWTVRVNPEDLSRAMVDMEAYLDGKLPAYTAEYRMLCVDGSWKWMLARGMVVARAEDGRPMRMIGTHTDITERKQAAEAIRQSEARLRLLLDSAAEAIYGLDIEGNCTFCNPSCLRLLGYQHAGELIGKNMHQLVHYKHADGMPFPVEECQIYKAFKTGVNTHVGDDVFWRADGTFFHVEYWSHPQLHDGVAMGAVVTFLDITERLHANERLLKLSLAVENSPASVVITNINGVIEYVNKRFTQVTGYLPEEAIGQNPRILNAGIQSQEFYREMWTTILAGREWQGEVYNKKKSGEIYLEHAFISPIRDDKGTVTHFVAVKEDITRRKQTEQELQKAMAAAEAASRAKGDFLANMSHEIRTPMNAIIGLSHLCLQTELTPKQKDYLHKVHGSAKALLGIINDVLDFSKIEAGKMSVEQVRFELEDVMSNLATVISTKAEEKGLEFLFETSLDVYPHLMGDPLRLGQVLINLVGNSVKFTEKGEVLVLTEVEAETADHVVLRFTVRDTGIGMTREQTDRMFRAFTQADTTTTRKFGGTGLGLSISKRIVELMNGKIWVESTPGEGSKFIFTAHFGKVVERRAGKRQIPSVNLQGIRVLAVDDNASCRHILQSYLESFTFKVTVAASGADALRVVEQADRDGMPYQLVVLDWKMPGMDGIEVARKIHELAGLSRMPKILLISSFSQSDMLKHVDGSVVDGILAKPFLQSELLNAALKIFGHAEAKAKRNAVTALFRPDLVAKISGAYLLLAEDNKINQQVARELLEKAGVTVSVAENGKEALARLWEEKFDGVLMDMQMPVMDGIAAAREIRKNPRFAGLPIIAMTANVLAGDLEQCLAVGMNDHITKPLDPNQMLATLAKWIIPSRPDAPPSAAPDLKAAQDPNTLPNLPEVRVDEGVRRMGNSIAGYCSILGKFRNGQRDTIAGIRSAIAADDWEKAERMAHTLKGLLGTLGAEKLQNRSAELETAIKGRVHVQVESLLPIVDVELTKLLAAIDRALQLRTADVGVSDTTAPTNMEELTSLIRQAKSQLEQFDSGVEDTVNRIRLMLGGDAAMKKALVSVEQCVSSYNYERGLIELTAICKSMGISCEG